MMNHGGAWLLRGAIALNMLSPAAALDNPFARGPLADFINVFREQAIPRRVVIWRHPEFNKGTIVVSTKERRLYYVLGEGQAIEYGVGVGREGFTWSGTKTITRKREWPDWRPPPQMLKRRPICRNIWRAGSTIRSARARSISDRANIASMAPTSRIPWEPPFRRDASA